MCTHVHVIKKKKKLSCIKFFSTTISNLQRVYAQRKEMLKTHSGDIIADRISACIFPERNIFFQSTCTRSFYWLRQTKERIVPSRVWMAFNASPEITILFHSQRAIGGRNFILSEAIRHSALLRLDGMDNARYSASHTAAEEIDSKCIDIRTYSSTQKSKKDSHSFLIY